MRLREFKICAISVLSFIGSVCTPDKATLKTENRALQCTTAGRYNAVPTNLLDVGCVCGLGPDLVGIHTVSLAARCRTAARSSTFNQGLEKIQIARGCNFAPIFALCPKEFLAPSMAGSTADVSTLYVVWTMMASLLRPRRIRSRKLPLICSVPNSLSRILLDQSPCGPPRLWDRSAVIEWLTFCLI